MDAKRGGLLVHVDDITAPVLERQGSCLQIHEQRGLRIQGLRLEGLADARRAKQRYVDLGLAGQAFFRRDDAEGHWVSLSVRGVGGRCQLGRASCRERVCPFVWISGGAVSLKKKP